MEFIKNNLNPSGKKVGDCVIRAIQYATNQTWPEVYQGLCAIGLELKDIPNSPKVYQKYLEDRGWKKNPMPKIPATGLKWSSGVRSEYATYHRLQLSQFVDENPKLLAIVSLANHLTVIDNGKLIDIWNCGRKSVGNYWTR